MKAFVVFAAVVAAASANPQLLVNNLWGGHALAYNTPIAAPVVSHAVVAPAVTKTQYHAQDELGQASYGYAHPGQAHAAVRDAAGNVRGSYAYVNPEGKEVRVEYVADGAGFRVASNALPVGPVAPAAPVVPLAVGPAPVQDTPEVIHARAAHAAAHAEALVRSGRKKRGVVATSVLPAVGYSNVISHPYAVNTWPTTYAASSVVAAPAVTYSAPAVTYSSPAVTYSAPAAVAYTAPVVAATHPVRAATLTKVVNTPGHAVSYRVD